MKPRWRSPSRLRPWSPRPGRSRAGIPWGRTSKTSDFAARRSPAPWGRAAVPRCAGSPSSRLLDHGPALLAQELHDVIRPAPALSGRARSLPPAERLRPRPGTGRRAGALVHVAHSGADLVEEPLDLLGLLGEDAGGDPRLRLVGFVDGLFRPRHLAHGQD